ncbi:hypothetical protein CYMTET_21399 [Cymbomonas tetramitiformis]|uniref:Uncharacterized protein n=1 Tax=Cymbomonas tetramitiformis TaxID=36881 RepID=A0AAE0L380_9CHLO|nr:hypothetical protein CYMTET_21399 [Cymbomonas tetramitiformis]
MNDSLPAVSQRRSIASSNAVQDVIKSSSSSSHVGIDRNLYTLPSVTSYSVGGRDDLPPPSFSGESEVTGTPSGAGRNFAPNHKVRFRAAGPLLSPWEDPPRGKRGGLKKFQEVPYQPKFEGSWASQMQNHQATGATPARASISSLRNSRRSTSSEETGGPPSSGAPLGDSAKAAAHLDDRTSPPPSPGSDIQGAANSRAPTVSKKELAEFERAQVASMVNSLREDAAELMNTRTSLQCEIAQLEERVQELKQEEAAAMAETMRATQQLKFSASSPKSPAAAGDGGTLQEASSSDKAIPHSPSHLSTLHLPSPIDTAVPVTHETAAPVCNQATASAPGETATSTPGETAALAPAETATSATSVTATSTTQAHASEAVDEGQPVKSAAELKGERAEVDSIAAPTATEPGPSQGVGPAAACHEPAEEKRSVEELLAELELTRQELSSSPPELFTTFSEAARVRAGQSSGGVEGVNWRSSDAGDCSLGEQSESLLASRIQEMEVAATRAAEEAKHTSEQYDALVKELEAGRTSVQTAAVEALEAFSPSNHV